MSTTKQVKSKQRVRDYGEVYTNEREVKAMCDLLPPEMFEIDKTFLEPACGNGAFLVEILARKLERCKDERDGLKALNSIFGIDIMQDNVCESRERLLKIYIDHFPYASRLSVSLAIEILNNRIVCDDALNPKTEIVKSWGLMSDKSYIKSKWLCKCDCGNEVSVPTDYLRRGHTQSCGCLQKERTIVSHKKHNNFDLSGEYGVGYTVKGELFYFDKEDFDKIKDYCWGISNDGYVYTVINDKYIRLHRLILQVNYESYVVDHINHITNDNRKINLRVCTQSENSKNRKPNQNSKSGYNGVTWNTQSGKWVANIKASGKYKYLGSFDSIEQAIKVRQEAEEKYYGDYAYNPNLIDNLITELYGADE